MLHRRIAPVLLLLVVLNIITPGQQQQQQATTADGRTVILNPDGTWKYAHGPGAQESVISIEAALVYTSGDVKPIARTAFHLLDQSLAQILRDAGLSVNRTWVQPRNDDAALANTYALSVFLEHEPFLSKANAAIKAHILQSVTTDFAGKATFAAVKPGTYFIMCVSRTAARRGLGHIVWDLKVDANPGTFNTVLDQNNAAFTR